MKSSQSQQQQNHHYVHMYKANQADHHRQPAPANNNFPNPSSTRNSYAKLSQQNLTVYNNTNNLSVSAAAGGGGGPQCRQSLSGSETDLSTSNENLTHEEKYVLRNSTRQEPQGEERLDVEDTCGGAVAYRSGICGLNSSYASMDQSSCNTLIIHRDRDDDDDEDDEEEETEEDEERHHNAAAAERLAGSTSRRPRYSRSQTPTPENGGRSHHMLHHQCLLARNKHGTASCEEISPSVLPKEITGIPKHYLDQSEVLKHLAKEVQTSANLHRTSSQEALHSQQQGFFSDEGFDLSKLPPPPEYPSWLTNANAANSTSPNPPPGTLSSGSSVSTPVNSATTSVEATADGGARLTNPPKSHGYGNSSRCALSRSQPDLSRLGRWDDVGVRKGGYLSQRPRTKGKASPSVSPALLHQRVHDFKYGLLGSVHDAISMEKIIEALEMENRMLKADLEMYSSKVSKLQKFEVDVQKVHQAYEDLVKSSQKRERLDLVVRNKLELEVRRLQEMNKDLKDQLEATSRHLLLRRPNLDLSDNSGAIQRRDHLIAQLIQHNKELTAAKERHEIELAAQRATLQEQRTHIDILDSALTNAQANVVKLEEECRKKQAYVERVAQLQRALTSLQVVSERREQMERKLRSQLERDLRELRHQQSGTGSSDGKGGCRSIMAGMGIAGNESHQSCDAGGSGRLSGGQMGLQYSSESDGGGICKDDELGVDGLKRTMREKDERIIALETEVSKWEQRYLEENAMRQIAIDAASMPKDAKIAALERTSQESEKLIAQARSDKLKQMDELHASNKRCADMESKMKDLESRLAERDAMIKVLQKHSLEKDAAFQNAMLRSPRHTPHPSFHSVGTSSVATASASVSSSSSSARTGCLSAAIVGVTSSADDGGGSVASPEAIGSTVVATSSGLPPTGVPSTAACSSSSSVTAQATKESLDEQLMKLDSELLSKDSIIHALRNEKEKYPSHYWMV